MPPSAGGFAPHLSLDYDSGGGVSELGMGWHLSGLLRVRRRTENGLPRFDASDAVEVAGLGVACDMLEISAGLFRPEFESGSFVRLQRAGSGAGTTWEARDKGGTTYRFGGDGFTESDGGHVASWLLRESIDLHGHHIKYTWDVTGGYALLQHVTWNDFGDSARNEVALSYETRPDAHTLFSAGIKQTLTKRLTKIDVNHGGALVRRYEIGYTPGVHSRIAQVELVGRDGTSRLPRLSLAYTDVSLAADGQVTAMQNPPGRSPTDANVDITDLDGDGLPDVLVTKAGAFRSYLNHDGKKWADGFDWAASDSPSVELASPGVQLGDLDGDGAIDLIVKSGVSDFRYFTGRNATSFGAAVPITTVPNFTFEDPDARLADMDGDRRVDIVLTTAAGLAIGYNLNGNDWSTPSIVGTVDQSQALRFSDGGHTQLCDVNGDRVQDFCYLRSQSLVYWLGRGRGVFEPAQTATGVPTWDASSPWELRDLDGDGWVDLVHVGVNQVDVALAIAAGKFDAPKTIHGTPTRGPNATVRFADMNGSGTTDIVWIDVSGDAAQAWQYLELFPKGRSGLLSRVDNGLGKIETMVYGPAALDAAAARDAGSPWTSRMNVAMPVVKSTSVDASLGDPVVTVAYGYRDGTWSPVERTFAGFAGGTERSLGDAYTPTLVQQFTYDVGIGDRTQRGLELTHQTLNEAGGIFSMGTATYKSRTLESAGSRSVHYTYKASQQMVSVELGDLANGRTTLVEYEQDNYGNVTAERNWGEVVAGDKLAGGDEAITLRTFANNTTDWILGRVATAEIQNAKGTRVRMDRTYYDGAPFTGLPLGQLARGDVTRAEAWVGGDVFDMVSSSSFDGDGNPVEVRDARGGAHLFTWEPSDHLSLSSESVKTENGLLTERATFDAVFGGVLTATAYNGKTTAIAYDPFGRVAAVARPGDSLEKPTVRYTYELAAPLSHITTEKRVWSGRDDVERSEDFVDGLGRRRASVEPFGQKFVVANIKLLDAKGNGRRSLRARFLDTAGVTPDLLQRADVPGMDTWRDPTGRVVRTHSQLGIETKSSFAPFVTKSWDGAQTDVASPYEHTPTVEAMDGLGRVIARTSTLQGKPFSATFLYDAAGALLAKTDPEGNVARYTYDGRGRRVLVDDPDSGKHAFSYDPNGNTLSHTKPDGSVRRFTYDLPGRLLTDDYNGDGKPEVTQTWDASGVLTRTSEPSGFTEYEYDDRLRVTKTRLGIKGGVYEMSRAFDAQDREYWKQYPDGSSLRINRDERGLISGYGNAVTMGFDADGMLMQTSFSTGVVREHGYDDDRRHVTDRARTARWDRPSGASLDVRRFEQHRRRQGCTSWRRPRSGPLRGLYVRQLLPAQRSKGQVGQCRVDLLAERQPAHAHEHGGEPPREQSCVRRQGGPSCADTIRHAHNHIRPSRTNDLRWRARVHLERR
jgi:YD repeat-containing protein